ncbi:MAG: hypothetical protein ACC628_26605 [Pirellulaceae bacterium]
MKRLAKRISLPLLLLLGLTLIGQQTAEAGRWRRRARRAYVRRPYYVAPPVVYAPGVRVYAPGVDVQVGPGVHVRAPGVRVNVGSWYPSYYYYGW